MYVKLENIDTGTRTPMGACTGWFANGVGSHVAQLVVAISTHYVTVTYTATYMLMSQITHCMLPQTTCDVYNVDHCLSQLQSNATGKKIHLEGTTKLKTYSFHCHYNSYICTYVHT